VLLRYMSSEGPNELQPGTEAAVPTGYMAGWLHTVSERRGYVVNIPASYSEGPGL
jgi:hypothetical protein